MVGHWGLLKGWLRNLVEGAYTPIGFVDLTVGACALSGLGLCGSSSGFLLDLFIAPFVPIVIGYVASSV